MKYSPENLLQYLSQKSQFDNFIKTKHNLEVWGEHIGISVKNFLRNCGFTIIHNHHYPQEWVCVGEKGKLIFGNEVYCKIFRTKK